MNTIVDVPLGSRKAAIGASLLKEVCGFGPSSLPWPCMALKWRLVHCEGVPVGGEGAESCRCRGTKSWPGPSVEDGLGVPLHKHLGLSFGSDSSIFI